ncbi:hypothetical protein CEP53_012800 [Fusarium sp. AF-6]|nr:hypothetical protein CEP53_012800 [Fusarium sp. AF-6]
MASDPSQDLDESIWKDATPVFAGIFKDKETVLWKDSSAYYKRPEDGEEPFKLRMRETGPTHHLSC